MIVYRAWWKFWPVICWRHLCWVKREHCCWGCLWEKDQETLRRTRPATLVGGPMDGKQLEVKIYANSLMVPRLPSRSFVMSQWQPEGGCISETLPKFEAMEYRREDRFVYVEKDDE